MKRFIPVLLATVVFIINNQAFAQKYRNKEVTLIAYKVNLDPEYHAKFTEYAHLFRDPVKPKHDRIIGHLTADIWDIIKQQLTNDVGMIILPLDAYGNKFSYDQYGFPNTSISRALKKGNSKFYISIDVDISPEFSSKYIIKTSAGTPRQVIQLATNEIKPRVIIKMNIYNDIGIIPVANTKGEAIESKVITLNDKYFDGFVNTNINSPYQTLYKLVNQAVKELVISVYSRK
ncbi:MAG TPA: hypothetical protein ENN49_07380 [Bacteroidales bacterium]|nr:hypothetical protein [Bacteroidales bacterium]